MEQDLQSIPGLKLLPNEPLAFHTSMAVGGPAKYFLEIETKEALLRALEILKASGMPWLMLGGGSNTLFGDKGYEGAILHLGKEFRLIRLGDRSDEIQAGAAAGLSAIMKFAQRNGL